ncbi:ABC transporter permease [Demequina sp. NBRC 110054]|uniref:ABC transporter permease n=1 Tax=Demequina sp. NBRC 110054 TaxID=1570343 RepID=UPI001F21F60B|nr:ABC transporter permease [Demequina sp. NBRC 110054]
MMTAATAEDSTSPSHQTLTQEGRPRRRPPAWVGTIVPPVLIAVGVIALWEALTAVLDIRPQILPSPSRIVSSGLDQADVISGHAWATLQVTFVGFSAALVVAWAIAVAVDFSPWLRRGIMPLLVASQTIPIIAIAPLMIIWFGFGLLPKVIVVALVTFFPVTVGLIEGFAKTDREAGALLSSMGAGRWKLFRYARLPSALPSFFTALRISIVYAVTGAIFSEYVGAQSGLGIYMSMQKNAFRTDLVLAAVAVTAVVSITLYLSTFLVERLVIPWASKERRARRGH